MATRLLTTRERIVEVDAAITACMAGQSWSLDGVSYTRANLRDLFEIRKYLEAKLQAEQQPSSIANFDLGGLGYD